MALRKIGEPIKRLWGSEHLDDLTTTGVWHQGRSLDASTSLGYPVPVAGLLEVHAPARTRMVYQRYTCFNSGDVYHRGAYDNVWQPWKRLQAT